MSSPLLIETPLSKTLIPFETRWKNKLFLKEVQRQRRHEQGLKQRVRVLDDGTKYTDAFGHLAHKKYYQPRPKIHCHICQRDIYKGNYQLHLQSVAHRALYFQARQAISYNNECPKALEICPSWMNLTT